MVQLIMK